MAAFFNTIVLPVLLSVIWVKWRPLSAKCVSCQLYFLLPYYLQSLTENRPHLRLKRRIRFYSSVAQCQILCQIYSTGDAVIVPPSSWMPCSAGVSVKSLCLFAPRKEHRDVILLAAVYQLAYKSDHNRTTSSFPKESHSQVWKLHAVPLEEIHQPSLHVNVVLNPIDMNGSYRQNGSIEP